MKPKSKLDVRGSIKNEKNQYSNTIRATVAYCVTNFLYEWPEPETSTAILRGWPKNVCVRTCACMCASHFLCDLLECERSHSETHTDSAWSNSQRCPLCIIRSADHSSSAASHIIPGHIIWLFVHAILTLTCPTTTTANATTADAKTTTT